LTGALAGFGRSHGSEFADRIASLNARFLAELLQLGIEQDLEDPDSATDPIARPQVDASDPVRCFHQLAAYAARLNAGAARAYESHIERVATGKITPGEVQQAASTYLEHRLPARLGRLVCLYFDLLNGLTELSTECEERYLRYLIDTSTSPDPAAPRAINLVAGVGETTSASLSVRNTADTQVTVRCAATEVRRADGVGPAFSPAITLAPDVFVLEPGQETNVEVCLQLDPSTYQPDALYVGELRVAHGDARRFDVPLRVTAVRGGQ
jgi:hypothetical protein